MNNNANNHANPATSAAAKDAFVPRQLPNIPGRSQSPPRHPPVNTSTGNHYGTLVHENLQNTKTAISPSVIQNPLTAPQGPLTNQTSNTTMKHSQSPPFMNATAKPARPQNFPQRPSPAQQPIKPNSGPAARSQQSSDDNDDTMKNLRKTFAGIFGDI